MENDLRNAVADIRDESSWTLEEKLEAMSNRDLEIVRAQAIAVRAALVTKPWRDDE